MARHSKESSERFYDYNLHLETRTLYIGDGDDGIDSSVAEHVIKAFHLFNNTNTDKTVKVLLNSFGGCWYNGMAIFDSIKHSISHVDAYVLGSAMSMGSVILQAADTRYLYPNATLMIHDGSQHLSGHTRDVINWGKYAEKLCDVMYQIYAERSGKPVSFWKKRCSHDTILTPSEAIALGLADYIVGDDNGEL